MQYEAAQTQASATEQNIALKAAQAESAAIGNLGQYNYPQQVHMDQLRAKIKLVQEESVSLEASKVSAQKEVELLKQEIEDYRARHLK